ncbi:MAG: hypothetical protein GXO92_08555 [FCB group bacterium]|nr:hypothetical protein [FCB group bacterium]
MKGNLIITIRSIIRFSQISCPGADELLNIKRRGVVNSLSWRRLSGQGPLLSLRRRVMYFVPMFVLSLLVPAVGTAIGTSFLSLPSTARELALGANPVIAVTSTANPALIRMGGNGIKLDFSYGQWLVGTKETTIGVTGRVFGGELGLRIRYAGIDDLELRSATPTDEPLAYFGAYGVAVGGTYARRLSVTTRLGVAVRIVNIQMYTASSNGIAVDLGGVQRIGKKLSVGLSLLNLGTMSPLANESPRLPVRVLGGMAYSYDYGGISNVVTASSEWLSTREALIFRLGNEIYWKKVIIQMSSQFSEQVAIVSGGFGFRVGIYQFHYGVQFGSRNLGTPQMIDVSVRLP